MAWNKLRMRWAPETAAMLVMEFVRERRLFAELVEFGKRRLR